MRNKLSVAFLMVVALFLPAPVNALQVTGYSSHTAIGNDITFNCANPQKVRITLCKPDTVRVDFSKDGIFPAARAGGAFLVTANFNYKTWPLVGYSVSDEGSYIKIQTSALTIRVQKSPFRIQYYNASNTSLITKDADDRGMDTADPRIRLTRDGSEHFFGWSCESKMLTEGDHYPLDKTGKKLNADWVKFLSHPKVSAPDAPFIYSTRGYGILFLNENTETGGSEVDTATAGQTNFNGDHYVNWNSSKISMLRYYFFYGPAWRDVIDRYTEVTGRPAKLTKKFYGVHHTWWEGTWPGTWSGDLSLPKSLSVYTDYAQKYRDNHIPCDVLVYDIMYPWALLGYSAGDGNPFGYGNPHTDLLSLFQQVRNKGFSIGGQARGWGITGYMGNAWNEDDDMADGVKDYRNHDRWNAALDRMPYAKVAVDRGFDFVWYDKMDWNLHGTAEDMHKLWTEAHNGDESMVYVRLGWQQQCGQAYPGSHAGDYLSQATDSKAWKVFPAMLDKGLVGYSLDFTDLGGDPWNTIGTALWPVISVHPTGGAGSRDDRPQDQTPWVLPPDQKNNIRKWRGFHYRMIPYLFTYGCIANTNGMPVIRHMMCHDSSNPNTWDKDRQGYVGDWLIVSPYYPDGDSGGVRNGIWLPAGTWYDFWTGTKYSGPTTISYTCDPGTGLANYQLPLFVKEGAIIPMMPDMEYIGQKAEDPLTLCVWPGGSSSFDLYEDTRPVITRFTCNHTPNMRTDISIPPFKGSLYGPATRKYVIELHTNKTLPIQVMRGSALLAKHISKSAFDSATEGWYYDGANGGICYCKPNGSGSSGFSVSVSYRTPGPAARVSCFASPATLAADGKSAAVLTAAICDREGLVVTTATAQVTFSIVQGGGTLSETNPLNTADGSAEVTYTAGTISGRTVIRVSSPGLEDGTAEVLLSGGPGEYAKPRLYPNPYRPGNGKMTFSFNETGMAPGKTVVKIYTLSGKLVAELEESGGKIEWDGENTRGLGIKRGLYIYVYETPDRKGTGKFLVK